MKLPTQRFSQKLMVTGAAVCIVCIIVNFAAIWSIYGKVGDCLDSACGLTWEQHVGKVTMYSGYAGLGLIVVGLVLFMLAAPPLKKKQHKP